MKKILGLFVTVILFSQLISAQKQEKLEKKWLAKDINLLKLIPKLLPPEIQTKESLEKIFGDKNQEHEVEFGAKFLENGSSGGYTSFRVSVYSYKNSIVSYKISASTSQNSWNLIKPHFIEAWSQIAQVPFQETDRGIFYEYKNEAILQDYKKSIGLYLGEIKQSEIPADLKDAYDYLTAPFNNIEVSTTGCGYSGESPKGKKMIELFIKAGRFDLIENILKGYNQGGRAYAVIALLKLKKNGLKLSNETEQTIEKIIELDTRIESCSGCLGFSTTVKKLLQAYNLL